MTDGATGSVPLDPSSPGPDLAFLRAFVHDLRSPLLVARKVVDEMRDGAMGVRRRERLLDEVADCLQAIDDVATAALALEAFDQEIAAGASAPVDVAELVVAAVSEADLPDPVEVELSDGSHLVVGQAHAVELALLRLLENASDHTPVATPIGVRVWNDERSVVIAVEDEGLGVPDHLRERIFEPFDRGEAPAYRGGLGLGLVLVARVAQLHGGRAWVEDVPGGGASFRLALPVMAQPDDEGRGTQAV